MTVNEAEFNTLAPLRPVIHLTPPAGWMNDPNGLCQIDGVWHAFYQHDPNSITHSIMHWGHASSPDLLHWEHHDVALAPDDLGVIFSGSAVIDTANTAGFGAGALIAIFTHDLDGLQRQSLAWSTDGGVTFTKYADNPVLIADEVDFRDPKVVGTADGWLMVLAVGERVDFYSSADLRSWEFASSYSFPLADSGVWECPDLLQLADSDDPAVTHVLTFCAATAGPHRHSATLYVPGSLNDGTFEPASKPVLLDHGPDFYATQTFYLPDAEAAPVAMAWMNSWEYSTTQPARNYRGAMSLARRLTLTGGQIRQEPVLDGAQYSEPLPFDQAVVSEPETALVVTGSEDLTVTLVGEAGPIATISINRESASISRHGEFMDHYAEHYSAPLDSPGPYLVVIDHGTIELFASDGLVTLSALVFGGAQWQAEISGADAVRRIW